MVGGRPARGPSSLQQRAEPFVRVQGRGAVYHCISRIVGGQKLLGSLEKETLRQMLWQQVAFSGVELITYCLMANHIRYTPLKVAV